MKTTIQKSVRCCLTLIFATLLFSSIGYAQTLTTDAADYHPGETVILTGSGFAPNEIVTMQVTHVDLTPPDTGDAHLPWDITADNNGDISTTWIVDPDAVGELLRANADGQTSSLHAQADFTDSDPNDGTGCLTSVITEGTGCVVSTIAGINQFWDVQEGGTYLITITGATDVGNGGTDPTIDIIVKNGQTGNTCGIVASQFPPFVAGTYSFEFTVPSPGCNTFPVRYGTNGCDENSGKWALDGNCEPIGHLRAANFDVSCTKLSNDEECDVTCIAPFDVVCSPGDDFVCLSSAPNPTPVPPVSYSGTQGGAVGFSDATTSSGCNYTLTRTWTVTNDCGSATCDQVYTYKLSTPVDVDADGPTTVCEGTCLTLIATEGLDSYQWYVDGNLIPDATDDSLQICDVGTGSYTVLVTNSCGCSSSSSATTVTINQNPSCNIVDPCPIINNMPGNSVCAEIDVPNGDSYTLTWTLTSSNNSWIITSTSGNCATFTSGAYVVNGQPTNPHLHLLVHDNVTGCESTCDLDISCQAERCAYTQGFYGNTQGTATCLGLSTTQAIYQALTVPSPANIVVGGYNGKSITICPTLADVACVICKLPGNGTPVALPGATTVCGASYPTWLTGNGTCSGPVNQRPKFKSALWGQAVTLAINLRLFTNLGNLRICSSGFTTYGVNVTDCATIVYSDAQNFCIPPSVLSCLGGTCSSGANKISDLMVLANKKLSGVSICNSVSLSNLNDALNAVNTGFDRCRITLTGAIRLDPAAVAETGTSNITVYPNPSSGEARINFVPVVDGKATIIIYNVDGSLVRDLFNNDVYEGSLYNLNFNTSTLPAGVYFIRLINGDASSVSKLVVLKEQE